VCVVDDFLSGQVSDVGNPTFGGFATVGSLGWSTNGMVSATRPDTDHNPGVIAINMSTSLIHLRLYGSQRTIYGALFPTSPFHLTWITRRTNTALIDTWRVGFIDNVNVNPPTNGVYFDLRPDAGGQMRFFAVVTANGISTETDTGVLDFNNYHTLEIRRNATFRFGETGTGTFDFYLNDVLVASHDANLLTSFTPLNLAMQLQNSTSTGDVRIDYVSLCLNGLRRTSYQ
jgi:hypothetical protein